MNEDKILEAIETYVRAFENADADLMEGLFWKDDPRFCEVENDRPKPFGKETFLAIGEWIRKHGKPGGKMRFYETNVHILSPEVAYSVSIRDEYEGEKAIPSRVTLIFLKKEGEWKIIHGHFSYVP
jgi:ketosteroid isomerase-like protein